MVEKNFEDDIVNSLEQSGYRIRLSKNYDKILGLDKETLFQFLNNSQSNEISKIEQDFGVKYQEKILDTINSELNTRGLIDVIRNGIQINDQKLTLSYRKPQSQKNQKLYGLYQKNIFSVIRQLHFDSTTNESIDLVIFLNGFVIATAELKDNFSKSTIEKAEEQYMSRNIDKTIFEFNKGSIVHFAVDYDNISMTTKLGNQDTVFRPFNKPDITDKKSYPTSFLWKEIWNQDNLLNILHNFIHLQVELDPNDSSRITNTDPDYSNIVFPRYHQWDVVDKIILDTKQNGTGNRYLIEHSTGAGKSFSIAWLAYALHSIRDNDGTSIFDGVIVISDRRIIVDQLRDEIKQFGEIDGLVPEIDSSEELGNELEHSKKIFVSTQQKFFGVSDRIEKLGGKHYAVIIDEAQSSQGGDASQKVMNALVEVDLDNFAQKIDLGKQNISYFAFSGTPKDKTLAIFGTELSDGTKVPFHKYTMKQAIEEGYILDVLENVTTFKRLFTIIQKGQEKSLDTKKAIREIMQMVNEDPQNISQKSQFIIEHFKNFTIKQIGEKAKAMIVTEKRKQAILYKLALDDYIEHLGLSIKTLVAFSGTVNMDGIDYTENSLNNKNHEKDFDITKKFSGDEYRILIVADKYRVGFNQPYLHTMYVDKKLKDVNAVQTLSRLNRTKNGKESVCVVDFVNTVEEIEESYSKYYQGVSLANEIDSNLLYKLYQYIMDFQVILEDDIETFWNLLNPGSGITTNNEELVASTADSIDRFLAIDEQARGEFNQFLVKFVKSYAYLTQVNDYEIKNLEKLYVFGRRLLTRLPNFGKIIPTSLRDDVSVRYLVIEKTFEGSIKLDSKPGILGKPINVGTPKRPDVLGTLSEVISKINEKYSKQTTTVAVKHCIEKFVKSLLLDNRVRSEFKSKDEVQTILDFGDYSSYFNENLDKMLLYNPKLFADIKNDPDRKKQIREESARIINEEIKSLGEIELPGISNDIPQNKLSYRTAFHSCNDFLWFEDRHLATHNLDFLENVFIDHNVSEIKILSSKMFNQGIDKEFFSRIKELKNKLQQKNIQLYVKIATSRELHKLCHDRFIIGSNTLWSLPPISAVFQGNASTFNQHIAGSSQFKQFSKEFDEWWNHPDALDIFTEWNKIENIDNLKSNSLSEPQTYHCRECGIEFKKSVKLTYPLCPDHYKPK